MWSNVKTFTAALVFLSAASLTAQDAAIPREGINISMPENSPLEVKSLTVDNSSATARGSAMALALHLSATCRNAGRNRVTGVMLGWAAQEGRPGGRAGGGGAGSHHANLC